MTGEIKALEAQLSALEADLQAEVQKKVDALNELAWALGDTDLQRAQSLSQIAHNLATSIDDGAQAYQLGIAYALRTLGYLNQRRGDHPLGLSQLLEAQEIFESLKHEDGLPDVFDGIAGIYFQIGSFPESLEYAYKQLDAAERMGDKRRIANAHNNLACIYFETGDHQRSIETLSHNLKIAAETGFKRIEALSHMNLADGYGADEDYDKALEHALSGLRVNREAGFELFEVYSHKVVGDIYLKMGNTSQALQYLEKALALSRVQESKPFEGPILLSMGQTYSDMQQFDLALDYLRQGLSVAQSIDAKGELFRIHLLMSEIHEQQEDFAQALHHFKQYQSVQESVFNEKADERLKVLQVVHDTETARKEAEIYQLKNVELGQEIAERVRAEAALRESEQNLRALMEQAPVGIVTIDMEGNVTDANPASLKILDSPNREATVGLNVLTLPPLVESGLSEKFRQVLETGKPQDVEARYTSFWGKQAYLRTRLVPRFNAQGEQVGAVQILEDISKRKQVEQALQLSRDRYDLATQAAKVGVWDWNLQTGEFYLDPNVKMILGYNDEEIPNDINVWASYVHPDDREAVMEAAQAHIEGQTPEYVFEHRMLHKDGTLRWIFVHGKAIRDKQGNAIRLVGTDTDVTGRKEAEEESRKLSRAVSQSPNAIIITDLDGTIEFANPAFSRISGYTWGEAVGQNPRILKSGQTPPEVYKELWATISRGEVWEGEFLNRKKNGELYWEAATIAPVKDQTGQITHYVAAKEDITRRKEAEAALQEAHDILEQRVKERTAELNEVIELLERQVAERERAEAEVRRRLVVEQRLATLSTSLMQATDLGKAVTDTLAGTGQLIGASRIFLFRLQIGGTTAHAIDEWCAPGVEPIFGHVHGLSFEEDSWLIQTLRQQGGFQVENVSEFPLEVQESIARFKVNGGEPRLALPVYAGEEMIGFLGCHGLTRSDPRYDQHLRTLEVVVGMLGNAWQRERALAALEGHVVARTQELSAFFDLTTLDSGERELPQVLEPAITRILELGYCRAMCVHLLDEDKTTLSLIAERNLPPGDEQGMREIVPHEDFSRWINQINDPVVTTDLSSFYLIPAPLRLAGFQTYLGTHFQAGGQTQGWVSYYRATARGFSLDETSILVALAEQVGVIVENHRLRQRIQEMAVLEERQRLARDLHDSVTQSLYSLTLFTRAGRESAEDGDISRLSSSLADLETTALQALREMRLLLYQLRPAALEAEGLVRALELRFDTVERRAGIQVDYEIKGSIDLTQPVETELYHISIEALNNTLKHAGAGRVSVCLCSRRDGFELKIADDGCGFDPAQAHSGLGLPSMRERVERLGGSLEIVSTPGAGTQVTVHVVNETH